MVELWDGEISQPTLSRALAKMKQTRKKKHTATANVTKPNEQRS
jgi:arginine repressor